MTAITGFLRSTTPKRKRSYLQDARHPTYVPACGQHHMLQVRASPWLLPLRTTCVGHELWIEYLTIFLERRTVGLRIALVQNLDHITSRLFINYAAVT